MLKPYQFSRNINTEEKTEQNHFRQSDWSYLFRHQKSWVVFQCWRILYCSMEMNNSLYSDGFLWAKKIKKCRWDWRVFCYFRLITVCQEKNGCRKSDFHTWQAHNTTFSRMFELKHVHEDKTTSLLLKIHKDSFGHCVHRTRQNCGSSWDSVYVKPCHDHFFSSVSRLKHLCYK